MVIPDIFTNIIQYNKGDVVYWNNEGRKIKARISKVYENKFPYENRVSYLVHGISESLISHCRQNQLTILLRH